MLSRYAANGLPVAAAQIKAGKLRVLATVGSVRSALMSDVLPFARTERGDRVPTA